nr:hypothetical protein [Klebsiella pneumoniae]
MFAGKKSAQIREILISESAWEEMTCLFAPSLTGTFDLTKADILKTIKIGCVIGTFTGAVFVIARLFKLKGF